jgi:methionyl-tRNA formyltransferase
VTYAHKIDKAEAVIDWRAPAAQIERRIRAFQPMPGASTTDAAGEGVKVWTAALEPGQATVAPGTVLSADASGVRVQTGEGVLRLLELQRAGGKRLPVADFLRGHPLSAGEVWGRAAPGH